MAGQDLPTQGAEGVSELGVWVAKTSWRRRCSWAGRGPHSEPGVPALLLSWRMTLEPAASFLLVSVSVWVK